MRGPFLAKPGSVLLTLSALLGSGPSLTRAEAASGVMTGVRIDSTAPLTDGTMRGPPRRPEVVSCLAIWASETRGRYALAFFC